MNRKPLWKVSVVTIPEAEDAVTELLQHLTGSPASSYTDLASGRTTVTLYLPAIPDPRVLRAGLKAGLARIKQCGLNIGAGRTALRKIRREDWAESWKRHFRPLEVSDALLIKPSWSRRRARKGQAVIVLDPGLSFGTGRHPTTSFCLQQLAARRGAHLEGVLPKENRSADRRVRAKKARMKSRDAATSDQLADSAVRAPGFGQHALETVHAQATRVSNDWRLESRQNRQAGKPALRSVDIPVRGFRGLSSPRSSFLDIGTGSGILAISAAKLGYAPVDAFDFDPEAVRIARVNARTNRVAGRIRFQRADLTKLPKRSAKRYDVVCANLISTLLVAERDRILNRLKAGGVLILAGILKREFPEVRRAYQNAGLKLMADRSENEWRSGAFAFAAKRKL